MSGMIGAFLGGFAIAAGVLAAYAVYKRTTGA